jgi:hypothetical protein
MSNNNNHKNNGTSGVPKGECMTALVTERKGIIRFETPTGQHVATLIVRETTRNNGTPGDHAELWLTGGIQYGTLKDFTLLELLHRAVNRDDHPNVTAD